MGIGGERAVHMVVPSGVDDPRRPSGGNLYDLQVCRELAGAGWSVRMHQVSGPWPDPRPVDTDSLGGRLEAIPDGSIVLVDGLVASAATSVLLRYAGRLRLVVLVHLPLGVDSEARARPERELLSRVSAVVTTSGWTRDWLVDRYGLDRARVGVAVPGVEPAVPATGSPTGASLLCVGALTPTKGQDLLVRALEQLHDLAWHCTCVGSHEVEPGFARSVCAQVARAGLVERVVFAGPRTGADLDAAYRAADVLVLPSRIETYGMVVVEALARGLPVIATRTGGTAEALGHSPDGTVPGMLVPPSDADAMATALRDWLTRPDLRADLRTSAAARRTTLPTWTDTAARLSEVLEHC